MEEMRPSSFEGKKKGVTIPCRRGGGRKRSLSLKKGKNRSQNFEIKEKEFYHKEGAGLFCEERHKSYLARKKKEKPLSSKKENPSIERRKKKETT